MENDYITYYIKTDCKHCGEEVVIEVKSKVSISNVTHKYDLVRED